MTQSNQKEIESDKNKFKEFIKRDFLYIIVLLIALITLVLSIGQMQDYQQQCNQHWVEQWEENCVDDSVVPNLFNETYEYDLKGFVMDNEYKD